MSEDYSNNARLSRRGLVRAAGICLATPAVAAPVKGGHEEEDRQGTTRSPDELIADMTLDEKVERVHGDAYEFNPADEDVTGYILPIPRLNIPDVKMSDGPMGVRHNEATALPSTLGLAATCDPELMRSYGRILGRESKAKDQDVVLAPGLNIVRVPELGRSFEYYGEDPYLSARATVNVIGGVQETGTIATAKHYVANNQEGAPVTEAGPDGFVSPQTAARRGSRQYVNAVVSDRALREIYLPAFKAAVTEAEVGAVMAAYNRVNGTYATENDRLLQGILKEEWGFDGYVVSDWTATRSVRAAANGLDLETPYGVHFDQPLHRAVQSGVVSEERLDDMVRRQLEPMDRIGSLEGDRVGLAGEQNTDRHQQLARRIAAEGAVLLKNEGGLPIEPDGIDSLAVIGHEIDTAKVGGGGSSDVTPPYSVSPLEGIRNRLGDDVRVRFTSGQDGTSEAVNIAESSDVAVVFGQGSATEGHDRADIILNDDQNQLIADVAAANENTVVVLNTGGPVTMPWVDDVRAILEMWYPGMEDGNATADVLFGDVIPGGKLPVTFGESRGDYPATSQRAYPGVGGRVEYTEGVFVGYRYFDDRRNEPLFPFGHGHSYTTFNFSNLQVTPRRTDPEAPLKVSVDIENVGKRAGKEVVQVYVGETQPCVPRPPRELRAFRKIDLRPGDQRRVEFELDRDALSYYDESEQTWRVDPGRFRIAVGASSRDIRLVETVEVTEETTYGGSTSVAAGRIVQ